MRRARVNGRLAWRACGSRRAPATSCRCSTPNERCSTRKIGSRRAAQPRRRDPRFVWWQADGFRRLHDRAARPDERGRRREAMTRWWIALMVIGGAAACRRLQPGDPVRGLSAAERAQFDSGRAVFDSVFTPEKGLGPLFNANGCKECHEDPAAGGTGDEVERHATAFHPRALAGTRLCDELAAQGGFVFQNHVTPLLHAALGIDSEPIPSVATAVGRRTTPEIFGFGLL